MAVKISIIKHSKIWLSISVIVVIVSLIGLFTKGLNYGIDFSGGNMFQLRFEKPVTLKELNPVLDKISKKIPEFSSKSRKVQISEAREVIIRTQELTGNKKEEFINDLETFAKFEITREDKVGASVGEELKKSAILALGIGAILIVIYITIRFEFRFAIAAILALVHDIAIAVGGIAILGYEIDTAFIAAILTILGYSINDTIVVFDRIRETLKRKSDLTFGEILDKSINQVMIRSINTSVTTLLAVLAILVFGGDTLKTFITTLLIGILAGTYSSVFIATPLIYMFEKNRDGKVDETKYFESEDDEKHEKILV